MTAKYIYGLLCPMTGRLRYIGAAVNPTDRLNEHIRESRRADRPVHRWIRGLQEAGQRPVVGIFCQVTDWIAAERLAIAKAREELADLLNVADGGDEPSCPRHVRAMNGRMVARATHDDPVRRKLWMLKQGLGNALRDGVVSEETKARLLVLAETYPETFGGFADLANGTRPRARARARTSP